MIHWKIFVRAVSIFTSLGMFATPTWADTQQLNFTSNSSSNHKATNQQINFTLNSKSDQTFAALMQEAEFLAKSLIEQEFATNPNTKEIAVRILGERRGQEVPLLFVTVSRASWQRQPEIEQWTKYFNNSAVLLGFLKPQTQKSNTPAPATANQPSNSPRTSETPTPQPTSIPQNTTSPPLMPRSSGSTPPSGLPASPSPSTQQPTSPPARTAAPSGASPEESDPGYR